MHRPMKYQPNIFNSLSLWDWAIFFLVLVITWITALCGLQSKRVADSSMVELLVMGRRLTLPFFVGTLVSTWYGGILGVTQIAFDKGIYNFITQGVFWYIAYLIFAFFLVDRLIPYQALGLPHLVCKMAGPKSGKLVAVFNFFHVLPVAYVVSMGLFLQILFEGSLLLSMSVGMGVVLLYSMRGGIAAIVWSDMVQFFVMCIAVFLVLIFSVYSFGWDFLPANLPSSHFSLTAGEHWSDLLIWGLIALSSLVDPNFYQRCFAAKNTSVAKKGILISTVFWVFFDICTTTGAMYARAHFPQADSGKAYLIYALSLLPEGLRGFFLAGILATILSTIDSYLFLAGATLYHDLLPQKFHNKKILYFASMLLVAAICVLLGSVFEGNIMNIWKTLGSYSVSCLFIPLMAVFLFPGKINDRVFFTTSLGGALAVTWSILSNSSLPGMYWGIGAGLLILLVSALKRPAF